MPIVLAAPLSSPGASGVLLPLQMRWTGFDGSDWDLSDPTKSLPGLGGGVKGLHMPRIDVFKSSTPLVPGVDLTGYSIPERPVYWPLIFQSASMEAWRAQHGAFFNSFHPIETGTWTVGSGKDERTLPLVGEFDGGYSFVRDPFVSGLALIGLELTAPRPLWRGRPIRRIFGAELGVDFISPEGAPPFNISPAATYQRASIENPGDEPAYLVWTVNGPTPEVSLGVGGAVIEVPFAIEEGETLVIDTDPAGQYATLDGVDVTRELGFQMFGPVPARGTSPLEIAVTGGSVIAELTPLYWRAF